MKRLLFLISIFFYLVPNEKVSKFDIMNQIKNLDWKGPGSYKLPISHSTLIVPKDRMILIGNKEANKYAFLNNHGSFDDELEAVTIDKNYEYSVFFTTRYGKYITLDDWSDLKPDELIEEYKRGTEIENVEREKNGFGKLHVIGWVQKPTLDRKTNIVYMAIEGFSDESKCSVINSIALKLGRCGYEKFNWVTDKYSYFSTTNELNIMLNAYNFNKHFRYEDYEPQPSGTTLNYGIAKVIAINLGINAVKSGGLIIFLKKIIGFIIAGLIALFFCLRKIFKKNED